jgi:hypothetical protein
MWRVAGRGHDKVLLINEHLIQTDPAPLLCVFSVIFFANQSQSGIKNKKPHKSGFL